MAPVTLKEEFLLCNNTWNIIGAQYMDLDNFFFFGFR